VCAAAAPEAGGDCPDDDHQDALHEKAELSTAIPAQQAARHSRKVRLAGRPPRRTCPHAAIRADDVTRVVETDSPHRERLDRRTLHEGICGATSPGRCRAERLCGPSRET